MHIGVIAVEKIHAGWNFFERAFDSGGAGLTTPRYAAQKRRAAAMPALPG